MRQDIYPTVLFNEIASVKYVIAQFCCKYRDKQLQHPNVLAKKLFKPIEEVRIPKRITPFDLVTKLN